jgi:hypothetical protein
MFGKISRYRLLPDTVIEDAAGQPIASKTLRMLPEVTGTFSHTVAAGDRVDHLAAKYYRQPTKWWRICDANPEFLSPQALTGQGPVVTVKFTLTEPKHKIISLNEVIRIFSQKPGVEKVLLEEEIRLVEREITGPPSKAVQVEEHHDQTLIITFNRMTISTELIVKRLKKYGFDPGTIVEIERVGKKITIPPDIVR